MMITTLRKSPAFWLTLAWGLVAPFGWIFRDRYQGLAFFPFFWPILAYCLVLWPLLLDRSLQRFARVSGLEFSQNGSWSWLGFNPRVGGVRQGRALVIEAWLDRDWSYPIYGSFEARLSLQLAVSCPNSAQFFKSSLLRHLWRRAFCSGAQAQIVRLENRHFRIEGGDPEELRAFLTPNRTKAISALASMKLLGAGTVFLSGSKLYFQSECFGLIGGFWLAPLLRSRIARLERIASALEQG